MSFIPLKYSNSSKKNFTSISVSYMNLLFIGFICLNSAPTSSITTFISCADLDMNFNSGKEESFESLLSLFDSLINSLFYSYLA